MNLSRNVVRFVFALSLTDLASTVVAQCRCGVTNLSESLFSDIVDDGSCNATSDCVINGTSIDTETYEAVKAYNCTSECFTIFGTPPAPISTLPQTTTTRGSGIPHSALIAIIVGAIVFSLFLICLVGIWLRKRKRKKKKSNKAITSQVDVCIRDDLHAIITGSSASSGHTKNDVNTSSVSSPKMTANDADPTSEKVPTKNNDSSQSVDHDSEELSRPPPATPKTQPARPALHENASPDDNGLKSHPIKFMNDSEWEDLENQLDDNSPKWKDSGTSLTSYLQSQGFATT